MSRPRPSGFTLIEVVLALAILSLVLTMVYTSLEQTSRINTQVTDTSDQYRVGRLALAKLADELMSAYYFAGDTASRFIGLDGLSPDGLDADQLSFTGLSRIRTEGAVASYHNELAYRLEGNTLLHTETLNPLGMGADNTQTFPLAEQVAGFQLRYLNGKSKEWQDGWDPAAGASGLPRAVEVTLFFPQGDGELNAVQRNVLPLSTVVNLPMGGG